MTSKPMSESVRFYEDAARQTRGFISAVRPEQFDPPTPCTEWNVRQLLDHIIGDEVLYAGSLSGTDAEPVPGGDHLESFDRLASQLLEAVRKAGTLEKTIDSPIGAMTGAELLNGAFMDTLIHGWDLAKATGQDTALDSGLVEACYSMFADQADGMRASGIIGPRVPVDPDASTQVKLLGALGRTA